MTMRGVRKPGSKTVTSAVRGALHNPATRAEAMSLIPGLRIGRAVARTGARDGRPQRHRPTRSPTAGGGWTPTRRSRTAWPWSSRGRRHRRRRRRVDPARAPTGSTPDRAAPGAAGGRGAGRARGRRVSVDTMRARGRRGGRRRRGDLMVNDVSGGLADPAMLGTVADAGAWLHRDALARALRDHAAACRLRRRGGRGARRTRRRRRDAALAAGIAPRAARARSGARVRQERRPQLGAAAAPGGRLEALGFPLLLAVSRKRFLGALLAAGTPRPPRERDAATALSGSRRARGGGGYAVHDVRGERRRHRHRRPIGGRRRGPAAEGMHDDHAERRVSARGFHGVFASERREGQTFVADAVLTVLRPSTDDDLATTVDYGALALGLVSAIERDPVDLIETLAGRLADVCLGPPLVGGDGHRPQARGADRGAVRRRGGHLHEAPRRAGRAVSARPIVLSLGGNLGDVGAALARAVALVAGLPQVRLTAVSAVYRTPAWGKTDQPDFLNIVALGETTLSPHDLLTGTAGHRGRGSAGCATSGGGRAHRHRPDRRRRRVLRRCPTDVAAPAGARAGLRAGAVAERRPGGTPAGHGLVHDLVAGLDTDDIVRVDDLDDRAAVTSPGPTIKPTRPWVLALASGATALLSALALGLWQDHGGSLPIRGWMSWGRRRAARGRRRVDGAGDPACAGPRSGRRWIRRPRCRGWCWARRAVLAGSALLGRLCRAGR